jgi:FAD/FMN-containing dehydrogenase
MKKALDVHGKYVDGLKELVPSRDFEAQCVFQPLPLVITSQSVARGGNVFGLDRVKHDSVLLLFMIELPNPATKKAAFDLLQPLVREIETFADSVDGRTDWRYLNYCDASQDPLGSYGEENIRLMRQVSEKYDPTGVFQHRVPGGYKLRSTQ